MTQKMHESMNITEITEIDGRDDDILFHGRHTNEVPSNLKCIEYRTTMVRTMLRNRNDEGEALCQQHKYEKQDSNTESFFIHLIIQDKHKKYIQSWV